MLGFLDECVAATWLGKGTGEFGVAQGGEQGHDPVERESNDGAGAGHSGSNSCQHEDAGADHGPDADHRRFE